VIVLNRSVMRDFYLKGYMNKDEALKLALEALERCVATCFDPYAHEQAMSWSEHFVNQTITAIKEALAQPEQLREENERVHVENRRLIDRIESIGVPIGVNGWLTTTTSQRPWVDLTDKEIEIIYERCSVWDKFKYERMLEAKLKEKNT
jgi:hypothetical protein